MEIPEGYKKSEVGVIPSDWEVESISTLISFPIQNGVFNNPARKGRGCKLINVGDLYSTIPINTKSLELFDANKDELARFGVTHGDIFFTRSSLTPDGIAHCNVYKKEENEDIVFDCHIIRVRANTNKIDPFFLFRYCIASLARKYLVAHAKTTTMTTIDQGVIASLPILVPPLPEQKAIALSLSDTDALIAACESTITKKRNIKQGAMQQLLTGKMRLPGFSSEWEVKKLGEISLVSSGGTPNRNNSIYWNGNIPWITTSQINFNTVSYPEEFITVLGLNNSAAKIYDEDTLLMAMYDQGKTRGKVAILGIKATTNQACASITINKNTCNKYIFFYLSHQYDEIRKLSNNGNQENLNGKIIKFIKIPLPPLPEQKAIAQILIDMDAEIAALEKKRDKYKAIKQGMMQELLTGKTRLKDDVDK